MSQRHSGYARQADDCYQTPPWVVRAIVPYLRKRCLHIWEPADGPNSQLAAALDEAGFQVVVTCNDFFAHTAPPTGRIDALCTNPPYGASGKLAVEFIEYALELEVPVIVLLLRIDFDSGKTRTHLFRDCRAFARKVVLLNRIVWFEHKGAPGPSENHAWFIWDQRHRGRPTIHYAGNPVAKQERMPRRKRCDECGVRWADTPSSLCPGCEAYREHQQ